MDYDEYQRWWQAEFDQQRKDDRASSRYMFFMMALLAANALIWLFGTAVDPSRIGFEIRIETKQKAESKP